MMRQSLRRLTVVFAAAAAAVVSLSAPAAAHGKATDATNYESTVLEAPDLDGVTWSVAGGDQYLTVTNTSAEELVVPGYRDEPYLRVGPDGVFANVASPAHYLNEDRFGEVSEMPPGVDPGAEPRWEQVADGQTWAWHDHRIHWMSMGDPPALTDPGTVTVIPMGDETDDWLVPFSIGGRAYEVVGRLRWVPPGTPLPWLLLGAVLTAPALLGLRRAREGDWTRSVIAPAALVLIAVSLANVIHLVNDFTVVPLPLGERMSGGLQTALFIVLGIAGGVIALRGRDGAFTALGVGSVAILLGQGVLYLDVLLRSQAATVFPAPLTRLVVGASLLQVLWVGAVVFVGNHALAVEDAARDATPEPATG